MSYQVVVCGGIAPDPLQTLEPVAGPALKNEMMLPAIFDPWAAHALYEAGHLAKQQAGTKITVVSLSPKAKLQQVMMTMAQKLPFELIAMDGPGGGFTDAAQVASALSAAIKTIQGLDLSKLLLFGGWESATRGAGVTMQMVAEQLGITEQFLAVDQLEILPGGELKIWERLEGGRQQVSICSGPPAMLAWATGHLPEPPNTPQVGMANMRVMMPAIQKARPTPVTAGCDFQDVSLPKQLRQTLIVKDKPAAEVAKELVEWIRK